MATVHNKTGYFIIQLDDAGSVFALCNLVINGENVLITEDTNVVQALDRQKQIIVGYQKELISDTDRTTRMETVVAELLSWAKQQGYVGSDLTSAASTA